MAGYRRDEAQVVQYTNALVNVCNNRYCNIGLLPVVPKLTLKNFLAVTKLFNFKRHQRALAHRTKENNMYKTLNGALAASPHVVANV